MFVLLLFSEGYDIWGQETVRISEPIMTYKKLFFTALWYWRDRLGIDDESDLLGFAPGAIVEIDAFYFGKNKIAAGVNN